MKHNEMGIIIWEHSVQNINEAIRRMENYQKIQSEVEQMMLQLIANHKKLHKHKVFSPSSLLPELVILIEQKQEYGFAERPTAKEDAGYKNLFESNRKTKREELSLPLSPQTLETDLDPMRNLFRKAFQNGEYSRISVVFHEYCSEQEYKLVKKQIFPFAFSKHYEQKKITVDGDSVELLFQLLVCRMEYEVKTSFYLDFFALHKKRQAEFLPLWREALQITQQEVQCRYRRKRKNQSNHAQEDYMKRKIF